MKKIISLYFLFILIQNCYSQTQIVYDFKTGSVTGMKSVKQGETITLKVDKVNTLGFNIKIDGGIVNYVTQTPTELQTIFRLPSQQAQDIQGAVSNSKVAAKTMQNLKAANPDSNNLESSLSDLETSCIEYIKVVNQIESWFTTRDRLIGYSNRIHLDPKTVTKDIKPEKIEDLDKLFDSFIQAYAKAFNNYSKAAKVADSLKASKATVDLSNANVVNDASKAFKDAYVTISQNLRQLIVDVHNLYSMLTDDEYYSVVSLPVQMDGDFIEFTVTITPIQTNTQSGGTSFKVKVPGRGGLKVDFSVGPTFSSGQNSKDDKFFLKTLASDTTKRIIGQSNNLNQLRPGIAAMMHAYIRTGSDFGIGPLFGVGAGFKSIDDVNINFYLGVSAVIGLRQKMIFSLGASYLPVDRLKSNYNLTDQYSSNTIKNAVLAEKSLLGSFFFSVSYNISSKQ